MWRRTNKSYTFQHEACNFIKKETLAQVFSCEFCKISANTFSCRTPLVAASVDFNKHYQKTSKIFKGYTKHISKLCIKPGIQERGAECGKRCEWVECYIPGNVLKHSGECPQTLRGMLLNISRNVAKHSGECPQTFRGRLANILGNEIKHSRECRQAFWGILPSIPGW